MVKNKKIAISELEYTFLLMSQEQLGVLHKSGIQKTDIYKKAMENFVPPYEQYLAKMLLEGLSELAKDKISSLLEQDMILKVGLILSNIADGKDLDRTEMLIKNLTREESTNVGYEGFS